MHREIRIIFYSLNITQQVTYNEKRQNATHLDNMLPGTVENELLIVAHLNLKQNMKT